MGLDDYDCAAAPTPAGLGSFEAAGAMNDHYSRSSSNMAASTSIPINSSNIGFQVCNSLPLPFLTRFLNIQYQFSCSPWSLVLQLLKKHGWKEGTGLGIAEQVCWIYAIHFPSFKCWHVSLCVFCILINCMVWIPVLQLLFSKFRLSSSLALCCLASELL